jgi:hypothetical protein
MVTVRRRKEKQGEQWSCWLVGCLVCRLVRVFAELQSCLIDAAQGLVSAGCKNRLVRCLVDSQVREVFIDA